MYRQERNRGPRPEPPGDIEIRLGVFLYILAIAAGATAAIHNGTCYTCFRTHVIWKGSHMEVCFYNDKTAGFGRWIFTWIVSLGTSTLGAVGAWFFQHHHKGAYYKHMGVYPIVYGIFVLLWVIELCLYLVPFIHEDPTKPGILCMQKIIWTSAAATLLWVILTLVGIWDWKRYGRRWEEYGLDDDRDDVPEMSQWGR
ncbi:hypothetical protein V8F20_004908 [Naviculisporaceae sp. PSN 640]